MNFPKQVIKIISVSAFSENFWLLASNITNWQNKHLLIDFAAWKWHIRENKRMLQLLRRRTLCSVAADPTWERDQLKIEKFFF